MDGLIVVIFVPNFWILNRPSDDLIWNQGIQKLAENRRKPMIFCFLGKILLIHKMWISDFPFFPEPVKNS